MEVAAIKGFVPTTPGFYEQFRTMPVRPSVFGITLVEDRPTISNDVERDPLSVGQPHGHPPVHAFLGVPLRVGATLIGMLGVANKVGGYRNDDQRLLSTFANQVAIAIDNARLYEQQREMVSRLVSVVDVTTGGAFGRSPRSRTDPWGSDASAAPPIPRTVDTPPAAPPLNRSQVEILGLVAEGFSNREIAARVNLSENTVKTHLQDIFRKLDVRNRVEAAIKATRDGLVPDSSRGEHR
jgi:DNA-binding CsgD family transcriptional regulator